MKVRDLLFPTAVMTPAVALGLWLSRGTGYEAATVGFVCAFAVLAMRGWRSRRVGEAQEPGDGSTFRDS